METTFWRDVVDARQDNFYKGLNHALFDQATPDQRRAFLQLHLNRLRQDPKMAKLYPDANDLAYHFNALISLFWDATIRPKRPALPQVPQTPPSPNPNLLQAQLIRMFNSEEFDRASLDGKQKLIQFAQQKLGYTPSVFNLNLANYWNPVIRVNRPSAPYAQPEYTLNKIRLTGNFEHDLNSINFDRASPGEVKMFFRYNLLLSALALRKFIKYLRHIWRPRNHAPFIIDDVASSDRRLRLQNYPWPRDSVVEDTEIYGSPPDALEGCDADEDGVIDPISMDPIPVADLVRIRTAGALRCYNLQTLVDINDATGIDPFTRLPFARDLRDAIFDLDLQRKGLMQTPETIRFHEEAEGLIEVFEAILDGFAEQHPAIVENYRRTLNNIRREVRNAIVTELNYPDEEFLLEMPEEDTIARMIQEARDNFEREINH